MSIWSWANPPRSFDLKDGGAFAAIFGGGSWAGQSVTDARVMQLSAVWAALRLSSNTKGTLPLGLFERKSEDDRPSADGHWLSDILTVSPNADQTPAEFLAGIHGCVSLRGNFFARKAGLRGTVANRQFAALETMHPDATTRRRDGGAVVFDWIDPDGKRVTLPEEEVFHVRGFSLGQHLGLSPLHHGRQVFGSGLAADEQAARIFRSSLAQNGFLAVDQELKEPQRVKLQKIMDDYVGASNAGKMMILEAGMKWVPLSMKPEEAQLLGSRRYNIEEACRIVGVPPILIGHAPEGQTMFGSGVEQLFLYWLQTSLRPDLVFLEQRIKKDLLPPAERRRFYAEHAVEGLLRADSDGRAKLYTSLVNAAIMKPAEGRRRENLPYDAEADQLFANAALVPVASLGQSPDPATNARNALATWLKLASSERLAA